MCKELGRIAQDWGDTKGMDTVHFMTHKEVAKILDDRVVTYTRIVCDYRSEKEDPNHKRLAAGGNLLN